MASRDLAGPSENFASYNARDPKDATLPKAAPVSALTVGEPPGLSRPKARPKAKSTLSPSSAFCFLQLS